MCKALHHVEYLSVYILCVCRNDATFNDQVCNHTTGVFWYNSASKI